MTTERQPHVRVKICGITNIEDARLAVALGADALGFLVGIRHKAEDAIGPQLAADIISNLPPFVSTVMVTHLLEAAKIAELCRQTGATTIQLHDDIPDSEIRALRKSLRSVRLIKAIQVAGLDAVARALSYRGLVDALLLDTANPAEDRIGGTGLTHDWKISKQIREDSPLPVMLAGGLDPQNVDAAINTVRPFAVDVNSGVERPDLQSGGRKDPGLLKAFIDLAKGIKD